MSKQKYDTQFSVYKLDYERTELYFLKEKKIEIDSIDDVEELIFDDIKEKLIERKERLSPAIGEKHGFKGIFFKTHHRPVWKGIASQFIGSQNDTQDFISNSHISYVLTYKKDNSLYLLTGGLGSNYISDFIQRNYGLYLLPKLINDDLPAVKAVLENRIIGNRLSDRRANRNSTSINVENELSTIFRELSLEFGSTIISELNIIDEGEKVPKILNVIAKDSLVVRKSLTLDKLACMIEKLVEIEKRRDKFSIGYLVSAKKYGYSSSELKDLMIEYFKSGQYENFVLVGNDIGEYYLGASKYLITDGSGNVIMEETKPISLCDIYSNFFGESISRSKVEEFLKLEVSTYDDTVPRLPATKLKDCIQGYVEDENHDLFYLFNSEWLVFDPKYSDALNDDFKKRFSNLVEIPASVKKILENSDKNTENDYNMMYKESSKLILAHTVSMNNVELADFIYFDESTETLYLVHNKGEFDGAGARDVMNQIITSAEFINNYRADTINGNKFFEKYFNKIKKKYPQNQCLNNLDFDEFLSMFKKKIVYVAGFLYKLSDNSTSSYAKFLTIDVNKRLIENNFELKLFNINGK